MPDSPEIMQYFTTLGVGGILAWLMFFIHRKDSERWAEQWRHQAELEKGRSEMLVQVVKENTIAITRNTIVSEAFHRRLDRNHVEHHLEENT